MAKIGPINSTVENFKLMILFHRFFISHHFEDQGPDYPIPKQQILDSLKRVADDNFLLDENGGKFFKWVENTGKRRNCSLQAMSPFPTVFKKHFYFRPVKTREKG